MSKSRIPWLNMPGYKPETWNPITGCSKVTTGCKFCWAERMSMRFGGEKYGPEGWAIKFHEDRLDEPLRWRKPRMCFVCSTGDLFHSKIHEERHSQIFGSMWGGQLKHKFLILTKRPLRAKYILDKMWPKNPLWVGVSVENADVKYRIKELKEIPAAIRYISFEPLLGPIGPVDLNGVDWVIVGCESGPGHRPMDEDWVREIRDQCIEQNVPFFYKQRYDGKTRIHMPELDGHKWEEYPI